MKSKYITLALFIIINTVIIIGSRKLEAKIITSDDESLKNKELLTYKKSSSDQVAVGCPPPMILDTNINHNYNGSNDYDHIGKLCSPNGCCLPCPVANALYKSNQIYNVYSILGYIGIISFVCVLFIVLSYLLLPNKRDHSGITVLLFHTSLLVFLGIISIHTKNNKDTMCHDDVTRATIVNDPVYCGLQGLTLIFSSFLLVLFCFLLILQLHFQAVWKSNFVKNHYNYFLIQIFATAVIFTLLPGISKQIDYEFGPVCMVNSSYKSWFFWYPLMVFIIPGFMMHIWTIVHMAELYWISSRAIITSTFPFKPSNNKRMRAQDLLTVLKMQWRVLMLAVIYLLAFILYQLFVVLEASKLDALKLPVDQRPEWITKWLECIFAGNGQNMCSKYSMPNIPSINTYVMAEGVISSLGILMFIIFGTSKNLWMEWKDLLTNGFNFKKSDVMSFYDAEHTQHEES